MDINDYNSRLSSARNNYREAANSLKETYEKDVEKLEETHEATRAKQKENFLAQKSELENRVEELGDNYNAKTREEIEKRQNDYRERVMSQKGDFDEQMTQTKKEFQQRLDDLSRDYKTNAMERDKVYDQYAQSADKRYKESLDNTMTRYQKEADRANAISREAQKNFREGMVDERRDLMGAHQEDRQKLIQDSVVSSNLAKTKHSDELATLRKVQASELNSRQAHHDQTMRNKQSQHELQNQRLRNSFEEMTARMDRDTKSEIERLNNASSQSMKEQEERFAVDRGGLERKLASLEESSSYYNTSNTEERVRKANEARVKNIFAQMDEQQLQNTHKQQRLGDKFQAELDAQSIRSRQEVGSKDQEINRLHREVIGGMKQKHMEDVETYQKSQRDTMAQAEKDVLSARQDKKSQSDKLHLEYGRQINALQEDNSQTIAAMRQEQAKEQGAFLKDVQRRTREERLDMQADFDNKFSIKVDQLNQKIDKLEKDRAHMIEKYESQIANMKRQELANDEHQRIIEEDRRAEDKRAFQRAFATQQREFDDQLKRIKRDVESQMAKIKHYNDVQVSTITRDYENRLVHERQDLEKEMKVKLGESEAEYLRLKNFHETQMAAVRDQYELKMEKLRQANTDANTKREERASSGLFNA